MSRKPSVSGPAVNRSSTLRRQEKLRAAIPAGRFGDVSDIVGAVQYLASPAAAYVTGAVIPVDGGYTAYSGV